jgi:hypothetical protein
MKESIIEKKIKVDYIKKYIEELREETQGLSCFMPVFEEIVDVEKLGYSVNTEEWNNAINEWNNSDDGTRFNKLYSAISKLQNKVLELEEELLTEALKDIGEEKV